MGTDASSMLLGITENESPACSNKYLRLGELDASINNGSSLEFFMAVNYQKKWRLTSTKPNPDKPKPKKMPRRHKDTKDFILLFILSVLVPLWRKEKSFATKCSINKLKSP